MQTPIRILVFVLGFTAMLSGAVRADDAGKMRTMMMAIGADSWIESYAKGMQRSDNPAGDPEDPSWTQAAREVFVHEEIFDTLVTRMTGQLSDAEVNDILAFLASDVGRTVTKMEIEAQDPSIADGVDLAGAQIAADLKQKAPERIAAYQNMLDAIDAVESGVTTALNMNFAVLSGMAASGRMSYQMSEAEILALIAAQEDMIREQVRTSAMENAAFTYRDLTDDDLEAYVGFLASDVGRKLYSVMNSAADDIMAERGRAFGKRMLDLQQTQEL